jgi:NADH:ubiquinone oxidoreductase subunit 6 (subunit J)
MDIFISVVCVTAGMALYQLGKRVVFARNRSHAAPRAAQIWQVLITFYLCVFQLLSIGLMTFLLRASILAFNGSL